jgi:hypothetical protein
MAKTNRQLLVANAPKILIKLLSHSNADIYSPNSAIKLHNSIKKQIKLIKEKTSLIKLSTPTVRERPTA